MDEKYVTRRNGCGHGAMGCLDGRLQAKDQLVSTLKLTYSFFSHILRTRNLPFCKGLKLVTTISALPVIASLPGMVRHLGPVSFSVLRDRG